MKNFKKKEKIIIIAEAGINHNGKLSKAFKMIDLAARAKADFIKFQTFVPEELSQKDLGLAKYQKKNTYFSSQLKMLKKYQIKFSDFLKIKKRCKEKKIKFLSSPFDIKSLKFLSKLNPEFIKIPSGEITNVPLLKKIGKLNKKIILSTGMSNMQEIKIAMNLLIKNGTSKNKISVLHCCTEYPANIKKLNLNSIKYLKDKLKCRVGFSDHSKGSEASLLSLALGASIFEKHFTLNKNLPGPDHKSSLSPQELINYVSKIKTFEKSIGLYLKKPYSHELKNSNVIRKKIIAKTKIKAGDVFSEINLTTKRARKGIPASMWDKIIGKKSKYSFDYDENITI